MLILRFRKYNNSLYKLSSDVQIVTAQGLQFIIFTLQQLPNLITTALLISAFKEVNESPEILKYIWYPELEIYGLDTFGRQKVLKEMSGVRVNRNRTITYELGLVSYPYM